MDADVVQSGGKMLQVIQGSVKDSDTPTKKIKPTLVLKSQFKPALITYSLSKIIKTSIYNNLSLHIIVKAL